MTMIRTTVLLPPALHQDIVITSRQEGKGMTVIVRELLDQALEMRSQLRLQRVYDALDHLSGSGPKGITDTSKSINDIVYGAHGAWKGQDG